MHRNKKAQLSIETMILYGLIALVALSAVAALIYFDVLNLGRYLPDSCSIGGAGDLKCEEMKASSTDAQIELGLRNVAQKPIESIEVTISDSTGVHLSEDITGDYSGSTNIPPGENVGISLDVPATSGKLLAGQVFEGTIYTKYKYVDGAITQEATGKIRVKVG